MDGAGKPTAFRRRDATRRDVGSLRRASAGARRGPDPRPSRARARARAPAETRAGAAVTDVVSESALKARRGFRRGGLERSSCWAGGAVEGPRQAPRSRARGRPSPPTARGVPVLGPHIHLPSLGLYPRTVVVGLGVEGIDI